MATLKNKQIQPIERMAQTAKAAGVTRNQLDNFLRGGYVPQPKQMLFHAACRECDKPNGPTEIGFGGARGPGKSFASIAQIALDDCQRTAGLKFLFLRKVGKAARESFEDLRIKVLSRTHHDYRRQEGVITFSNGSRILFGHFNAEKDIDNYLGIEYDGAVIEEATQLSESKYKQIKTCIRTSKAGWRPRIYLTTNPGGLGHAWFKKKFIDPFRKAAETTTRFIPATFRDNRLLNPDYIKSLDDLVGWLKQAWRDGDWDIAAGQFFSNWRYDHHTLKADEFELPAHWPVWAAMDYGFNHPTVVYLLAQNDGITYVVDEFWQRKQLPPQNTDGIKAMFARHGVTIDRLWAFVAGLDVFAQGKDKDAQTIADQYREYGIKLLPAITDRINGAGQLLKLLGDPDKHIAPKLRIVDKCVRLIECIPALCHDPHRPEDVLKVDIDDDGNGGDDAYDCLRYGLMAQLRRWEVA